MSARKFVIWRSKADGAWEQVGAPGPKSKILNEMYDRHEQAKSSGSPWQYTAHPEGVDPNA